MKTTDAEEFDLWWHRVANHSTIRPSETWLAACEIKNKEIQQLEAKLAEAEKIVEWTSKFHNKDCEVMKGNMWCNCIKREPKVAPKYNPPSGKFDEIYYEGVKALEEGEDDY